MRKILFFILFFLCSIANAQEKCYISDTISRSIGNLELGEFITKEMISETFDLPNIYSEEKYFDFSCYKAYTKLTYMSIEWNEISIDFEHTDNLAIAFQFHKYSKNGLNAEYTVLKDQFEALYGKGKEELSPGGQCLTCRWEDAKTSVSITHYMRTIISPPELILAIIDKTTK